MKIILFVLIITGSIFSQQKYLSIEKNSQGGFKFYNNSGEHIFEFISQNADSATLANLNKMFDKADKNEKQQIAVINLQENGFDYNILIVSLSTLAGIFLGWILNRKSSKHQTLLQNKKEWLDKFRSKASETLSLIYSFNYNLKVVTENKATDELSKNILSASQKFLIEKSDYIDESVWHLQFLLDSNNEKHMYLSDGLDEFELFTASPKRNYQRAIDLHKVIVQDVKDIISDEQQKINSGKLTESFLSKFKKWFNSNLNDKI